MSTTKLSDGYKMFIINGLYIKCGKPMSFKKFLKSDLLKELVEERKAGVDRFDKEEDQDEAN